MLAGGNWPYRNQIVWTSDAILYLDIRGKFAGPDPVSPVTGYEVELYTLMMAEISIFQNPTAQLPDTMISDGNLPDWNRIAQLPDIRFDP